MKKIIKKTFMVFMIYMVKHIFPFLIDESSTPNNTEFLLCYNPGCQR